MRCIVVDNNGDWKARKDEFQGYVRGSLENIDKRLIRHDTKFDKLFTQLNKNDNAIERIKVKMGIIAAGFGVIFAVVFNWVKNMWR